MLINSFIKKSTLKPTNKCSLLAGDLDSGVVGNGLSMGIGSCLCDAEATIGVVIAKKESSNLAVTLPAEWHL